MLFGDATPQRPPSGLDNGSAKSSSRTAKQPALIAESGTLHDVPAIHVAAPVDTTGAGDFFNGGYLAARLAGHGPQEAARRAHRVAAAVVQVRGALAPFETLRAAFEN